MAGRTSHEALGGFWPICETSASDGKPFFATGTVFADHMRVDTRLWLEEGGGFHPARQTAWLATDEIKLRLPTMIQLPTSSTGVRFPGHRHRPSVGEGGLVGVKGPKWPSLGRSPSGNRRKRGGWRAYHANPRCTLNFGRSFTVLRCVGMRRHKRKHTSLM